jgi:sporulation protein YlmC with PRC-barrel domain
MAKQQACQLNAFNNRISRRKRPMNKAVVFAAALLLAPLPAAGQQTTGSQSFGSPPTANQNPALANETPAFAGESNERTSALLDQLARSDLRDRVASAIETVEGACAADIERYCGEVTPGEGRIALCMQAYADRLSRRCRFTLFRVSRNIRQAVSAIADECLNGLKSQCGTAQNIGDCAEQKSAAISPACHTVVAALRHAGQKLAALQNMPVYSADGKDLGKVVEVQRSADGKIQSVQIQIGRFLGLGDKVVTINPDQIQQMADRLMLRMNSDQVGSLPEAKKQGM